MSVCRFQRRKLSSPMKSRAESVVGYHWRSHSSQSQGSSCQPHVAAGRSSYLFASSNTLRATPFGEGGHCTVAMRSLYLVFICFFGVFAEPKTYFKEEFSDGDKWSERWVQSEHSGRELGKFVLTSGKFYGDAEKDKGIQTSEDARFYGLSTKFESFGNDGKTVVIQFSVKHEQNIDCGGGYIKLFDCSLDPKDLHGESPYLIMFGPDICGPGTKKVHVIFNYKGKNLLIEKDIRCKDDVYTHLYTLIVKPDNTYIVKIDNEKVESGELEKDWKFLPPKKIKDPEAKKPEDWDDRAKIDDVDDKKPDDWDQPEYIPDPDATKPEDWDDDMDGEWEPPQINNPAYKGEWKPRQIDNPNYKGPWVHPEIDNPEYEPDENLYRYKEICAVGLDLWQVKSGTIFDNFLITDDEDYAQKFGEETWGVTKEGERKMKEQQEEEEKKKLEAESKKDEEEDEEEEDEEEDTKTEEEEKHEHVHEEF